MSYTVNGYPITDLIQSGYTEVTAPTQYTGLTANGHDTKPIACCMDFGYQVNGTDIATLYRAPQFNYTLSNTGTTIDLTTPTYRKFKHLSGIIYAGGAGGGSGGARRYDATDFKISRGPAGGSGGYGGYAWVREFDITGYKSVYCVIGDGGAGGVLTSISNNTDGSPGADGGNSRIRAYKIGAVDGNFTPIVAANGGLGGYGGGTGATPVVDGNGAVGTTILTSEYTLSGGGSARNIAINDAYLYRNAAYSFGGTAGSVGSNLSYSPGGNGGAGSEGQGWLWLLYKKE
uniref:Uncharacterized protein n=1 Tax=viral metagenome TaxID=1070528 RepID=A0A6C0LR48_9ZZZZ